MENYQWVLAQNRNKRTFIAAIRAISGLTNFKSNMSKIALFIFFVSHSHILMAFDICQVMLHKLLCWELTSYVTVYTYDIEPSKFMSEKDVLFLTFRTYTLFTPGKIIKAFNKWFS